MSWWTEIGDVVQFNEKHDWRGVIGIITEIKQIDGGDVKYRIGVPMLNGGSCLYLLPRIGSGV